MIAKRHHRTVRMRGSVKTLFARLRTVLPEVLPMLYALHRTKPVNF